VKPADPYAALADALAGVVRQAVADAVAQVLTSAGGDTAAMVSVTEAAARLGLGVTTTKRLVASGQLRSALVEGRRLVSVAAIADYVRSLDAS
jgi:excisionase family DNA binding protein